MSDVRENFDEDLKRAPARRARRKNRLLSLVVLVIWLTGLISFAVFNSSASTSESREQFLKAEFSQASVQVPGGDFSRFTHTNPMHARLPCLLCHRRETNSPIPSRPGSNGHMPCAGCHSQQFTDSGSPICTICHTDVQTGALKPFPPLKSFNLRFDHQLHVTRARSGNGCATCHKPDRRGVGLSIPAGFNAHTICFQCHTPRTQGPGGQDISSCGVCHKLGSYSRTSATAVAYRESFSHAAHLARRGLSCGDCHNVRSGAGQGMQVTKPQPLMHHAPAGAQSCMTCHNGRRAFGETEFSTCTRCHRGATWHF
ncbi:MAG: hypothetical protein AUG51_26160 [Acidobacteria bacterium 13_1_20CM_3_53_8]|nr:MAG: hypothetical protein AUG51_26160 [Acidobacteria bacterium 13_1_20CM_3_53_8]